MANNVKKPFELNAVLHALQRFEHLCALPLEVAYFHAGWGGEARATKAEFESNVNWQISVFSRFRDLEESLKKWMPDVVITHDHLERDARPKFDDIDARDDFFPGGAQLHKPRLWAWALRQERSRAKNSLTPFIVGEVSSSGYDGPVPRHALRSDRSGEQKRIEVDDAYDMVLYGHGGSNDTPWDVAWQMWVFLKKLEGEEAIRPRSDDIGSRIRVVSKFIRQQVEHYSHEENDLEHVLPARRFFSHCAKTWCIHHAGESIDGSVWSKQRLLGACFDEACLKQCDLRDSRLVGVTFRRARLEGVDFSNARMEGVAMQEATFVNCTLSGAKFSEANLDGADLRGVQLSDVGLADTSLIGANLEGAKLTKTALSSAKMQRSILVGAQCDDLDAYHVDFQEADLTGASLTKAKLCGGKFNGANLVSCDLSGAEVENCCFLGVSGLTASQVRSAEGWEFALFDEKMVMKLGLVGATAVDLNDLDFRKKVGLKAHMPKLREQLINYQIRMNSARKQHGLQPVAVTEKTIWPSLLDFSARE